MSKEQTFTGTGTMLRFMLRRDRIRIPIWIIAITLSIVISLISFEELYVTDAERQTMAMTMTNPAAIALSGPDLYLENYTVGAMISHQMIGMAGIVVALMSVLFIVRHTRKEEETGRAELIRASVTGRHANTTAALILVLGLNIVLALVLALSMGGLGYESVTWEGSFLFSVALASIGFIFAAIAIFFVQLMETARGATGFGTGMIAVAFTLRAVGDIDNSLLSWLTPIGWAQQTAAFVDNDWSPLLPSFSFTIIFTLIAYKLSTMRDVGGGMIRPRQGRAHATSLLTNPIGLAYRLQRTSLIIWSFALLIFGMSYGAFLGEAEEMMASMEDTLNEMLPQMEDGVIADSFAAMFISVSAMVAAIPALLSLLKLRGEEKAGRIEPLLSGALARTRLLGSYLVIALLGSVFLLFMAGFGMGITGSQSMNDSSYLLDLTIAGLAFAPALWVAIGLGVALFGLWPKKAAFSWAVVIYAFFVVYLGGALQLPEWVMNLSPYEHISRIPAEDLVITPLLSLTAIAIGLMIVGITAFTKRDIDM
ncbi:ABC transporter permease [Bacillus shivajii]|uniref:ABC transporter permease n=1 Tax=Bacillus shivajii TaxID=1983719 RepID=UPI001CFBC795|nr:ABC transporter permease [Bacillus shivajii]UCZ53573.1 ABC transporter permease [Bacillus shivajii]